MGCVDYKRVKYINTSFSAWHTPEILNTLNSLILTVVNG